MSKSRPVVVLVSRDLRLCAQPEMYLSTQEHLADTIKEETLGQM
jgi:hypothetical protein